MKTNIIITTIIIWQNYNYQFDLFLRLRGRAMAAATMVAGLVSVLTSGLWPMAYGRSGEGLRG